MRGSSAFARPPSQPRQMQKHKRSCGNGGFQNKRESILAGANQMITCLLFLRGRNQKPVPEFKRQPYFHSWAPMALCFESEKDVGCVFSMLPLLPGFLALKGNQEEKHLFLLGRGFPKKETQTHTHTHTHTKETSYQKLHVESAGRRGPSPVILDGSIAFLAREELRICFARPAYPKPKEEKHVGWPQKDSMAIFPIWWECHVLVSASGHAKHLSIHPMCCVMDVGTSKYIPERWPRTLRHVTSCALMRPIHAKDHGSWASPNAERLCHSVPCKSSSHWYCGFSCQGPGGSWMYRLIS